MTGLNGVHALLAILTQQAQTTKHPQVTKIDLKQLEALLQESRLLNERLLKIEKALAISRTHDLEGIELDIEGGSKPEGSWPAASAVRDVINSQARQQGYGYGQSQKASALDIEPFSYREFHDGGKHLSDDVRHILIQQYTATELDEMFSKPGMNFGPHRWSADHISSFESDSGGEGGKFALMSIAFSLLLLTLFALVS